MEMTVLENIKTLVMNLQDKDNIKACDCANELEKISENSADVYAFFDVFFAMLESDNSYVRNRAITLIGANAKWDINNKIDEIIDKFLKHIKDVKPITARQCIKTLPVIARYKPQLRQIIENSLHSADFSTVKESMRTLLVKDACKALDEISKF